MRSLVLPFLLATTSLAGAASVPTTGMSLIFDDEFSGSSVDTTKWQLGTEPNGNQWGSNSYFVTSAPSDASLLPRVYSVANGYLTITANYDPNFVDPTNWGRHWYSGNLSTAFTGGRTSAQFRRGMLEMRAKLPSNKGAWSGAWALNLKSFARGGDPNGQIELDGMEVFNESPTGFPVTVHDWNDPAYNKTAQATTSWASGLPSDLSLDYHVYDYKVDDTNLTTYVDGVQVAQVPLYRATTVDSFFWMIDNAEGGNGWPVTQPPVGKTTMQIDYVRIYSADAGAVAIAPAPVSPPATDTLVLAVGEDAYKGDAQFTVSVDGTQVGGTYTVKTLFKPNGSTENATFYGNFGTGSHTVVVNFLNDLYDSGGDRNLYVMSITLDGVKKQTNSFQGSTGPVSYTLP